MPNHLHGNLFLHDSDNVGAHCNVPLPDTQTEEFGKLTVNLIPTIIKLFKSTVAKQINELRGTPGKPVWQRGRRSVRLKEFDYSQTGAYFVTICTKDRDCLFGEIIDETVRLSQGGKIADECWRNIPAHYPHAV